MVLAAAGFRIGAFTAKALRAGAALAWDFGAALGTALRATFLAGAFTTTVGTLALRAGAAGAARAFTAGAFLAGVLDAGAFLAAAFFSAALDGKASATPALAALERRSDGVGSTLAAGLACFTLVIVGGYCLWRKTARA